MGSMGLLLGVMVLGLSIRGGDGLRAFGNVRI